MEKYKGVGFIKNFTSDGSKLILCLLSVVLISLFICEPVVNAGDSGKINSVNKLNREIERAGANWSASLNPVARMSDAEQEHLIGAKLRDVPDSERTSLVGLEPVGLPEEYDWRNATYGGVTGDWTTPIRDQGNCGSCWDFSAVGVVEMLNDLASGNPGYNDWENLSEQKILSCCDYCGHGCNGGYIYEAFNYMSESGIVTEDCMPYEAKDTIPCDSGCGETPQTIGPWTYLTTDVETIKTAILNYGAVSAGFAVYEDFRYYSSGVYEHVMGNYLGGHAIVLVGWGKTESGEGYWIAKNSWGTEWGESGWFKIKWGSCGINRNVIMATLSDFYNTDLTINVEGPSGYAVEGIDVFVDGDHKGETDSSGTLTVSVISDVKHNVVVVEDDEVDVETLGYSMFLTREIQPSASSQTMNLSAGNATLVNLSSSQLDGSALEAWLTFHINEMVYLGARTIGGFIPFYVSPGTYDLVLWNWQNNQSDTNEEVYKLRKDGVDLTYDRSLSFDAGVMPTSQFRIVEFPGTEFDWFDMRVFWQDGFYSAPIWYLEEGGRAVVSSGELALDNYLVFETTTSDQEVTWEYGLGAYYGTADPGQVVEIRAGGSLQLLLGTGKPQYIVGERARIENGVRDNYGNPVFNVWKETQDISSTERKPLLCKVTGEKDSKVPEADSFTLYGIDGEPVNSSWERFYPSVNVTSPSGVSKLNYDARFWNTRYLYLTGNELGVYNTEIELQTHLGDLANTDDFFLTSGPDRIATFAAGTWWVDANGNDKWDGITMDLRIDDFGSAGNQAAIGDLNGDGKDELAVFQDGTWWIDKNHNFMWDGEPEDKKVQGYGNAGNKVAIGDFDSDYQDEIATFNGGTWWIDMDNDGVWDGDPPDKEVKGFGNANNQVAAGDFNNDGKDEIATFTAGTWWIDLNNNDKWDGEPEDAKVEGYGTAGNIVAMGNVQSYADNATPLQLADTKKASVNSVLAYPNPVSGRGEVTFQVRGDGIEYSKVDVFKSSGGRVYSSDYVSGMGVTWDLTSGEQGGIANGLYLFQVSAIDEDGEKLKSEFKKLLVLE